MVDFQTIGVLMTGVSVTVAAIYYMFTLRINMKNQELSLKSQQQADETRQAQLFMQVFNRYQEEQFWSSYQAVMGENWKSYDDWSKDIASPFGVTFFIVASYLEGIGVLVRRGLISVDLVNDILGGITVMFWNKIGDYIREHRAKAGYPGFGHDLEYLYEEVMKLKPVGFAPRTSLGLRTHTDSGDDI